MSDSGIDVTRFSPDAQKIPGFGELVATINRSPTLVGQINSLPINTQIDFTEGFGVYYDPNAGRIVLSRHFLPDGANGIAYEDVCLALAHELGHVPKGGIADINLPDPVSYAKDVLRAEGMALVNEYRVGP